MQKAKKIRGIGIGIFVVLVAGIVVFFVIQNKKNKEDDSDDIEENYEDDFEDTSKDAYEDVKAYKVKRKSQEERLDLDNEDELFKRVNKSQFKPVKKIEKSPVNNTPENNKSNENKTEIIEKYFKNLEEKRKDKHF